MINTKTLGVNTSERVRRVLTLSVIAVLSLFMFSLAYTVSAATLYRQLEFGMTGSDVSDLQTFLAQDSSVYPQGLVTGYFGSLTKAAVSNFQAKNGIAVVGRVGPITMAAINAQMGTGLGDRSAPFIGPLTITTTNSSATIVWNTSENSSAIVYYSTLPISEIEASPSSGVVIGGQNVVGNSDFRVSHSTTLSALSPNTTYYYVVYVRDASGNESVTLQSTLHTNL